LGRKITKIGADGLPYFTNMSVSTAWGYMKLLRTYIHDAMLHELIDKDPSAGIKVKREESKNIKWLTLEEIQQIESAELSSGSLTRVRDLFIFMCYTGLAYSDAVSFSADNLETDGEYTFVTGRRQKTNEEYFVLLLPEAKAILDKYDYQLPKISNQQFNIRLKKLAKEIGIDKPLTSHFARHSCAMMLLNRGVRMETVSKILGHANTKVTESTYASILKKTVGDEMKTLIKE
jgi:site-specific recombinase XerD